MAEKTFINSKMTPGRRYAQRFETLIEEACYQEGLDRQLNEFAKTHVVVSLTPYVHGPNVNVIVEYLVDLTENRIKDMCDDFLITLASREWKEKNEPRTKDELRKDPEFIQFKTWCEDLVCWEDKNGLYGKPIIVGGGNSYMPPLLAELVDAQDKEKVEYYKTLFPDYAKKVHEAKVAYFSKKEASKTTVTGLTESN